MYEVQVITAAGEKTYTFEDFYEALSFRERMKAQGVIVGKVKKVEEGCDELD